MNKINHVCRIVVSFQKCAQLNNLHTVLNLAEIQKFLSFRRNTVGFINMSQTRLTSFFNVTPKKPTEINEEPENETKSPSTSPKSENENNLPITNGKNKRTSKRQRLESSDSDSSPMKVKQLSPAITSDKKKKTKRQRIESSESEPDNDVHQKSEEKEVNVEKLTVKTYQSPKSKKKIKKDDSPLLEKNIKVKVEKSPKEKKEEKPFVDEKSPKEKKVSINKSPEKSLKKQKDDSPKKTEVKDKPKTMNSFFIKKEKDVKQEKEEDGDIVPEEQYNPSKSKYHPIKDACWSKGEEVPYLALAKTFEAIEEISARLKIVEILSNYFRSVIVLTPDDLLPSVYMCLNQLAPAYHSLELGIAETYLMKAIGQCTGRTLAQVKASAHKTGDLGLVAEQARATQRTMFAPPKLKIRKVFAILKEIAHMTGHASVNKKINKIQSLYTACRLSEARYLIRSLEGKLRIGLAEQSVLQALAAAFTLSGEGEGEGEGDSCKGLSQEQLKAKIDANALIIKSTYCECPNYESVLPAALSRGLAALPALCRLTPGVPLKPMLAHPTKGISEVFNRFENNSFTCEWKYDGERAQIHVPQWEGEGGERPDFSNAAVFSRNQENNTSKYPDVLRRLPALLKEDVYSCVLDSEAVAYDTVNKKILPFQILSTRKRKDAVESEIKVQVCVFIFDLLYLNGRALVREPFEKRRELLRTHFNTVEGEWHFATSQDCTTMEEVQQFLEESIRGSCEGLMVKMLAGDNSKYDIARRSHNWLKIKKDYLDGVGDTIDALVIAGYWGRGKRAGTLGGLLLAARDQASDEYQSLCKIGTGFSEKDLKEITEKLEEFKADGPKSYYRFDPTLSPDVWFSPSLVVEVKCADLSLSPSHRAAIGELHPEKGISLRFPRFIRIREDKTPEDVTSARQIMDMYLSQDQVKNQGSKQQFNDDFY